MIIGPSKPPLLSLKRPPLLSLRPLLCRLPNLRPFVTTNRLSAPTSLGDLLKDVFDNQKFFNNFNKQGASSSGLFKNQYLVDPQGLIQFSKDSLVEAKSLVTNILQQVNNEQGKLTFIKKLDQLSDLLCRVIDMAEFIRVAHPKLKWADAAQQTHEIMFEYMNQLNTNVDLYTHLHSILNDQSVVDKLSHEEVQVGEYLKQDFERSGIQMDEDSRNNFVALTQEISLLGSHFSNEIHELKSYWCEVDAKEFELIEDQFLKSQIYDHQSKAPKKNRKSSIYIPLAGNIPFTLLTDCGVESIRRKVWLSLHNSTDEQITYLDAFIKYRAVLAKMLGYKSFSHYQLEHKMAKNPKNVMAFLDTLQKNLLTKENGVMKEIKSLYKYKPGADLSLLNDDILSEVKPWDRDYLINRLQMDQHQSKNVDPLIIRNYLSVGTIMSGLDQLFKSLYNITLIPEAASHDETWDKSQVRKIKVFDLTNNKVLGYLYLDFWSPKVFPSHFTIVCSRKLNTDINSESLDTIKSQVQLDECDNYQLPVISLVFNFLKPATIFNLSSDEPTLLTLDQVDTIFHEMGHAMHSMTGKTNLQNLSGTRCLTDFVELPSVLMESFSKDPRVLCKIAKHHQTGECLPESVLSQYQKQRFLLEESETFMQSKMALLDQVLHNENIITQLSQDFNLFSSSVIYHNLESKLKLFSDQWSSWHGKFPHLFSYGAVYYSYLLDRAIADKVWTEMFSKDPWSPESGAKYRNSILKWGGTKDPWLCLADALDNEELKKGDSKAMELISSHSNI